MEQQVCTAQEFGSPLAYAILEDPTYPEHAHSCYELLYVLQGRVRIYISGTSCTAGPTNWYFFLEVSSMAMFPRQGHKC